MPADLNRDPIAYLRSRREKLACTHRDSTSTVTDLAEHRTLVRRYTHGVY